MSLRPNPNRARMPGPWADDDDPMVAGAGCLTILFLIAWVVFMAWPKL